MTALKSYASRPSPVPCSFWQCVVLKTWYRVWHAYSLASCTKPTPSAFNVYYFLMPSARQRCTDLGSGSACRKVQQSVLLQPARRSPHNHQPNRCSYHLAPKSTRRRSPVSWPWDSSVTKPSRLCGQQGTTSMLLSAGCCSTVFSGACHCFPPAAYSTRNYLSAATNWPLYPSAGWHHCPWWTTMEANRSWPADDSCKFHICKHCQDRPSLRPIERSDDRHTVPVHPLYMPEACVSC